VDEIDEHTDPDDLFRVAPDTFTAARNALAKALKATDKAKAAEVAKRKRPTPTAWVLNVIAVDQPALVEALGESADELKAALASGDGGAVRDAQRDQRSRLEDIVKAATRELAAHGQSTSSTNDQRLRATLQAAVVDDTVADLLRAGRLDKDFEASGFGFGDTTATAVRGSAKPKSPAKTAKTTTAAPTAAETAKTASATTSAGPTAHERRRAEEAERRLRLARERYERLVDEAEQLEDVAKDLAAVAVEREAAASDAARVAREAREDADRAASRASAARAKADTAKP